MKARLCLLILPLLLAGCVAYQGGIPPGYAMEPGYGSPPVVQVAPPPLVVMPPVVLELGTFFGRTYWSNGYRYRYYGYHGGRHHYRRR